MTWDLMEGKWIHGQRKACGTLHTGKITGTGSAIEGYAGRPVQNESEEYPGWLDILGDPVARLTDMRYTSHAIHDRDHRQNVL